MASSQQGRLEILDDVKTTAGIIKEVLAILILYLGFRREKKSKK
jgi:hypothetical protein